MKCTKCGTDLDQTGDCTFCSTNANSFENPNPKNQYSNQPDQPNQNANNPNMYYNGYYQMNRQAFSEEVSVARWIGRMFLSWIPFVGLLVSFIMLIVWACSDRFERSSKNWAIATIIMGLINLIITVIIFIAFSSVIIGIFNMFLYELS